MHSPGANSSTTYRSKLTVNCEGCFTSGSLTGLVSAGSIVSPCLVDPTDFLGSSDLRITGRTMLYRNFGVFGTDLYCTTLALSLSTPYCTVLYLARSGQ